MRALRLSTLLWGSLLGLPACFQVDQPVCSYSCGTGGACPSDYTCQADNYCHRNGTTAACEFSDAATVDESVPFDLETADAGSTDGAPDL